MYFKISRYNPQTIMSNEKNQQDLIKQYVVSASDQFNKNWCFRYFFSSLFFISDCFHCLASCKIWFNGKPPIQREYLELKTYEKTYSLVLRTAPVSKYKPISKAPITCMFFSNKGKAYNFREALKPPPPRDAKLRTNTHKIAIKKIDDTFFGSRLRKQNRRVHSRPWIPTKSRG